MIKSIILEDVRENRENLRNMLSTECPEVEVLDEAENAEQAYEMIKSLKPDLVFLDIQLDKGTSFDLLDQLNKEDAIDFKIIFVTGYGSLEIATRAFEFSALDFISKPIVPERLKSAVEKATQPPVDYEFFKHQLEIQYRQQIQILLDSLRHPTAKNRHMAFHLNKGIIEFVEVDEIVRCEADDVVTKIYMRNGVQMTAMRNLGYYGKVLTTEYNFFQISNDTVVNLDHVKRYNHNQLTLTLFDGKQITASRRCGQDFRRFINGSSEYKNLEGNESPLDLFKKWFGRK